MHGDIADEVAEFVCIDDLALNTAVWTFFGCRKVDGDRIRDGRAQSGWRDTGSDMGCDGSKDIPPVESAADRGEMIGGIAKLTDLDYILLFEMRLKTPLSGPTKHACLVNTAMERRSEPTPGSTTTTWTVPLGK